MSDGNERLREIAEAAAETRGLMIGSAFFEPYKEFSFRWKMRADGLEMHVSDYLDEAPDGVLFDFLKGAVDYALGRKGRGFGPDFTEYVRSDAYIEAKRPVYLRRSRNLTRSDTGEFRNIYDAVQRLLDSGLLFASDLDNTYFTWTRNLNRTRLGYCSQMFRTVAISQVFDRLDVPEYAFDFVTYHECLHLRQGYRPFNRRPHDAAFHRQEKLFPMYREAEDYIRKIPVMFR